MDTIGQTGGSAGTSVRDLESHEGAVNLRGPIALVLAFFFFTWTSKFWLLTITHIYIVTRKAIMMRILLTISATVASAERSFSKPKLIKNVLRSTMSQTFLLI